MPDTPDDPVAMTPDQRRHEIAALLARGVLRLRERLPKAPGSSPCRTPEKSSESRLEGLDVGAKTSLHVFDRTACRKAGNHHERNG